MTTKSKTGPLTVEQLTWLRCFQEAFKRGELLIPTRSLGEAKRLQHQLYRTAKILLEREDLRQLYPEYLEARLNCSVRPVELPEPREFQGELCPAGALVYRANMTPTMKAINAVLGLEHDTVVKEVKHKIAVESEQRVAKQLRDGERFIQTITDEPCEVRGANSSAGKPAATTAVVNPYGIALDE